MRFKWPGATEAALVNNTTVTTGSDAHSSNDEKFDEKNPAKVEEQFSDDESVNKVDEDASHGVQRVQAMTLVWSKKELIMAYIM